MITFMSRALPFTLALALLACGSGSDPVSQGREDSQVVARIGDRTITMKEVEDRWRAEDAAAHLDAVFKLYEGRRNALDALVAEHLLTEAAQGSGLSPEAYAEAEISRRAAAVTDQDVASFYKANVGEMQGRPLAEMAPLITRFLTEQKREEARQAVVAELRTRGSAAVSVLLDAPRYDVPIAATDPSVGDEDAEITIVEFSDFQCPYCQRAVPTLERLKETYGDRLRVVWKDFPLTRIHPQAQKAAEAAHCAGDQQKFWPYHDLLFANQETLDEPALKRFAQQLSLDPARFATCLESSTYAARVQEGVAEGTRLGVSSTPTMFVNGRLVPGAYPYDAMVRIVEEELARLKQ